MKILLNSNFHPKLCHFAHLYKKSVHWKRSSPFCGLFSGQKFCVVYKKSFLDSQRVTGPALRGGRGHVPHFGGLAPYILLTIPITNMAIYNLITTFLTNSSCFQLKSTLEVLWTIKFSYYFFVKRSYTRVQFPGRVRPKDLKVGIHSFLLDVQH